MSIRFTVPVLLFAAAFACWELSPRAAELVPAPMPSADTPYDLILAVDVSGSMIARFCPAGRDNTKRENYVAPSDPEGIRWDGIHFALDIAQPKDRVALVLFSGSAAVLTEAVEDGGFVQLDKLYELKPGVKKSGRTILKELVTELQQKEREVARSNRKIDRPEQEEKITDYDLQTLSSAKRKFTLLSGTSVVLMLDTLCRRSRLLQQIEKGRQGWMLLFTDGRDEDPFSGGQPSEAVRAKNVYPRKTYADYLKKLEEGRKVAGGLKKWVEPYVRDFREKQVPIVTFALGEYCDEELLRAIGSGTSYKARTNLELLTLLQDVGWELREYWHVALKSRRRGEAEESFLLPRLDQWRDLGLLLYCQPRASTDKTVRMQAPPADAVRALRIDGNIAPWTPLRSRSHWYYAIDSEESGRLGLPLNKEPEMVVRPPKEAARAILAFRTRKPLFTFETPVPDEQFTPLDVIPLQIDFNPPQVDGKSAFEVDDFRVTATLARLDGSGKIVRQLKPAPAEPDGHDARRQFRAEVVLDADPATKGKPELVGRYNVDVEIDFAHGMLAGARRRLLRRTIQILPYPNVRLTRARIELGNKSPNAARGILTAEIPIKGHRAGPVATLTARIDRKPRGSKETDVDVVLAPVALEVRGGKGALHLEVPAKAWSALPVGRYDGGLVRVHAPWAEGKDDATAELIVEKTAYDVEAPDLINFDLSDRAKKTVKRSIPVTLATQLETHETVWLSSVVDATAARQPRELEFESMSKKGSKIKLGVQGLGRDHSKRIHKTSGGEPEKFELQLVSVPDLAPGWYEKRLFLVGEAVAPRPLRVRVMVDQLRIAVEEEGKLRDVERLPLLGMAATHVRRTLVLRSALADKTLPPLDRALGNRLANPLYARLSDRDQLVVALAITGRDRLRMEVEVPPSVLEGKYLLPLELPLEVEDDEGKRQQQLASLSVEVQVVHHGVRPDVPPDRPLRLPLKKCSTEAAQEIRLTSDAERQTPVRWTVKLAPPSNLGPARILRGEWIDVKYRGQSVLRSASSPRPSVTREDPLPLTVSVDAAHLDPGLYRTRLEFRGEVDTPPIEGQANGVDIEVLVPGRVPIAEWDREVRPEVGIPLPLRVLVACYDCESGEGDLRLASRTGPEGSIRLNESKRRSVRKDTAVSDLIYYEYATTVLPRQAGKMHVEVRWPRLCLAPSVGAEPADQYVLPLPEMDVLGRVEVVPGDLSYVGESVVVRAALTPGTLPSGELLRLRARNRDNKDAEMIDLELHDDGNSDSGDEQAGDGVYSVRYAFPEAGSYEITLPPGKSVRLQPGLARLGFDFKQRVTSGEMLYGGGTLSQVLLAPVPNLNLETLSMPDILEVENKQSGPCQFRAILRYPAKLHDSRGLSQRDLDHIELRGFDGEQHLKGSLLCAECQGQMEETGDPTQLRGTLQPGGKLELGVLCELSEHAIKQLYDGDGNHPAFGQANGLVMELHLKWGEEGKGIERVLRVPISVRTRSWKVHGIVVSVFFLFLAVGSYLVYRRWLARYLWPLPAAGEKRGMSRFSFVREMFGKRRKPAEPQRSKKEPQIEPAPLPAPPEESPLQPPDY